MRISEKPKLGKKFSVAAFVFFLNRKTRTQQKIKGKRHGKKINKKY